MDFIDFLEEFVGVAGVEPTLPSTEGWENLADEGLDAESADLTSPVHSTGLYSLASLF